MKQFKITRGKGFHLPIGDYILSVQFGRDSYCDNYDNEECIGQSKTVRCENAEVAILYKDGGFVTQKILDQMARAESIKDKMVDECVIASVTPDEVQQIIALLVTLDNLKKEGAI